MAAQERPPIPLPTTTTSYELEGFDSFFVGGTAGSSTAVENNGAIRCGLDVEKGLKNDDTSTTGSAKAGSSIFIFRSPEQEAKL